MSFVSGSDAKYAILKAMQANGMANARSTMLRMASPQQVSALQSGDVDRLYPWEPRVHGDAGGAGACHLKGLGHFDATATLRSSALRVELAAESMRK